MNDSESDEKLELRTIHEIYEAEVLSKLEEKYKDKFDDSINPFSFLAPPAQGTVKREEPKIGRNDPCRCGSGKKYKKCCG